MVEPMRRAALLIVIAFAFGAASCGGTPETGESPSGGETAQAEEFDETPPAPLVPEHDLPADNDERSVWIREHLTLYEQAYRQCEDMVDTSSPIQSESIRCERNSLRTRA